MTDQQSTESSKPCISMFDDPSAFMAPQFSPYSYPVILLFFREAAIHDRAFRLRRL